MSGQCSLFSAFKIQSNSLDAPQPQQFKLTSLQVFTFPAMLVLVLANVVVSLLRHPVWLLRCSVNISIKRSVYSSSLLSWTWVCYISFPEVTWQFLFALLLHCKFTHMMNNLTPEKTIDWSCVLPHLYTACKHFSMTEVLKSNFINVITLLN